MSIINEIKRIKESTQKAYESAENKGATIPEIKNIDNLSVLIAFKEGGVNLLLLSLKKIQDLKKLLKELLLI